MLKNNPVVKKLVETGEVRIGKLAQQLLSNEKFVGTVQTIVGGRSRPRARWTRACAARCRR